MKKNNVNGIKKLNVKVILMLLAIFTISIQSKNSYAEEQSEKTQSIEIKSDSLRCLNITGPSDSKYDEFLARVEKFFDKKSFNDLEKIFNKPNPDAEHTGYYNLD